MGALDDFTHAQIAPRLMAGEQVFGMAYMTVWDRNAGRFGVGPRLGAATDRRLFLIETELQADYPQPKNLGISEWWYEDVDNMNVMGEDARANFTQFAFVSKPGFGPRFDQAQDADRLSIHGAPYLGFANPAWLRTQFVPWLKPRIDARAFPPTVVRAGMRDAFLRDRAGAAFHQRAVSVANSQAALKKLPLRLAYAGVALCVLGALLGSYGSVRNFGKAATHSESAETSRGYYSKEKDATKKAHLKSDFELEEYFASGATQAAVANLTFAVICMAGLIGLLIFAKKKAKNGATLSSPSMPTSTQAL